MSEYQTKKLFSGITNIDEDLISEAQTARPAAKRPAWKKWVAAAACLCLLVAGGTALFRFNSAHTVQHWSTGFRAENYFKYSNTGLSGESASSSLADSAIPYAQTRYFSDWREQLEEDEAIPALDSHPLFTCAAHYNEDGSLYSLELTWHRQGSMEDYSNLKIVAGTQEVPQIQDCIGVEVDEKGNIVEPTVTVTERDGVSIVAEGGARRDKVMTFQNDSGWYQITGSWNDDESSVVALLDWLWEHPLDLTRFPLEAGDNYELCSLSDYPDAFQDELPDFAAFGFVANAAYLTLKNGVPSRIECHYVAHVDDETLVRESTYHFVEGYTTMHWCVETEPDVYDLDASIGELDELTQDQVLSVLETESHVTFTWKNGDVVTVYPTSAQEAWELIHSLQG